MVKTSTLFESKSDLYAAARPLYPDTLFEYIASLTDQHEAAWDCASGNGQAAIGLARHFDHVEATDVSKGQISNAFENKKIRYSLQPVEKTEFQDGQFDLVNVAQALHWFDFENLWGEVNCVLKSDGVFIAYSYAWSNVNPEIDEAVEQHLRKVIEPYWAPNNRLCWDRYRTVKFPFEIIDSPIFDLKNNWDLEQYFNYFHTWSATRRCMDERGSYFVEQAKQHVMKLWGDPTEKKVIKTQLTVIIGNAWS